MDRHKCNSIHHRAICDVSNKYNSEAPNKHVIMVNLHKISAGFHWKLSSFSFLSFTYSAICIKISTFFSQNIQSICFYWCACHITWISWWVFFIYHLCCINHMTNMSRNTGTIFQVLAEIYIKLAGKRMVPVISVSVTKGLEWPNVIWQLCNIIIISIWKSRSKRSRCNRCVTVIKSFQLLG